MQKYSFYNQISKNEDFKIKKNLQAGSFSKNTNVNINKLLNRVKIEKKNESKKKVIFFALGVFLITSMSMFVTILR